ncbi:MAG TPA: rhomboid family intramembrane serine protease [Caldilineaceae bacterium]|nr:rhomboid family intramembrane serine protease [Caldilineaceae bacterium]
MIPLQDTVPARNLPLINWLLILGNVAVFLFEVSLGPQLEPFVYAYGVLPVRFLTVGGLGEWLTLFSSMFLHAGWWHLASNLLALFIFGDNVEDRMGHLRYLVFYLLTGATAGLVHIYTNAGSSVPTIGASGAISGVLGAYLILFPTARVITFVPLFFLPWFVEVPALIYLGLWFLSQLLNGLFALGIGYQAYGGVAWWAHAGGFIAGMALVQLFARRPQTPQWYPDEYWPW